MKARLLDSDILSLILRADSHVVQQARDYARAQGKAAVSVITCFEILRGLQYSNATRKLAAFEKFIATNFVIDLDLAASRRAASIHVDLRSAGTPLEDADLLIAAIALANNCVLVTNNVAHYRRIPGLEFENWAE